MNPDQHYVQKIALNVLHEISNQDTDYDWSNKNARSANLTDFAKNSKKKYSYKEEKTLRLPLLSRHKKAISQIPQQNLIKPRQNIRQKPHSVRMTFKYDLSNGLSKYQANENAYSTLQQRKRENEIQIVKTWLSKKRLQCRSLNNIINKYKEDSGKYKATNEIVPFNIKSLI